MRIVTFSILILLLLPPAANAQEVLTLEGTFRQGGLVVGRTDPKAEVEFEGRTVRVSPNGVFLIGFGRNAKPTATLKVRLPDGHEEVQQIEVGQREYKVQRIDGLPPKKVTPPPEVLEQLKVERRKTGAARKIDLPETWFLDEWIWPAEGRISGVYGSQRILNGQPRNPHMGVDVAAPAGDPIVAPADGQIVLAENDMYYNGNMVFIDHGHGLKTAYLHMSRIDVKVGQFVKRGERIGAIGATGRVTGPHLHWMAYLFNTRLDPAFLVPERPGSRG
jgi:murein DD-endopeptidase MepM/ murein hydrolase activator NlpD